MIQALGIQKCEELQIDRIWAKHLHPRHVKTRVKTEKKRTSYL